MAGRDIKKSSKREEWETNENYPTKASVDLPVLLADLGIRHLEALMYCRFVAYQDRQEELSYTRLKASLGCGASRVSTARKALVELGMVKIDSLGEQRTAGLIVTPLKMKDWNIKTLIANADTPKRVLKINEIYSKCEWFNEKTDGQ